MVRRTRRFALPLAMLGLSAAPLAASAQEPPQPAPASTSPEAEEAARLTAEVVRLYGTGQYAAATPLAERALQIRERVLGRDHPSTLSSANSLAQLCKAQGRYAEAEPLYRRALEGSERVLGRDHADTLTSANNLASLYQDQGRYAEAEPLYRRALEGSERVLGRDHPETLTSANNLAELYQAQGRYAESEPLYRRVLEGFERVLGRNHPSTLTSANNLAVLYKDQGRYAEAEPLYRRALEAKERVLGRDHPSTLTSANNLAVLYQAQGRYAESEPLYRRALETRERVLGRDHPNTLTSAGNLASLYQDQGRYAESEPLYRRALEAKERVLGRDHPSTLTSANNLALLYRAQGRYAEAEPLFRRALETSERVLGRDHPDTLTSANNLALLYQDQGRYAEAKPLFRRALEGYERVLGREHPDTLTSAEILVIAQVGLDQSSASAVAPARLLVEGIRQRRQRGSANQQARAQQAREVSTVSARFALFADAALAGGDQPGLRGEAFTALQDSIAGAADRSIAEQAARYYAAGRNAQLGALILERQQLQDRWTHLDDDLAAAFGDDPNVTSTRPALIRAELEQVQARIETIETRLKAEAPDFFALTEPTPLDVAAAQHLLQQEPDAAILLVVPSRFGTHVMAVTRDDIQWRRSDWNAEQMGEAVMRLRWAAGAQVPDEQNAEWSRGLPAGALPPFPRALSHDLYRQVVAPVAPLLAGKSRIYIAAGGSLAGLPFSLLVAAPPPAGRDDDAATLRATHWFGDDAALVHIPSLQSLALLRQAPQAPGTERRFMGIGNPVLRDPTQVVSGCPLPDVTVASNQLPDVRSLFRPGRTRSGGLMVDLQKLHCLLNLAGAGPELEGVRSGLHAPPSSLLVQRAATEPNVRVARRAELSRADIILFSTHGFTAEEASGIGEPGLVLTPPANQTDDDDGYLSASEVTTLDLHADWVILSACNTATSTRDNAGLGQLSRAFFYAGARNLLASHWNVSDETAPILITQTITRTGVNRAEAFRQAMHAVRTDPSHPQWAHPFYWAPFVLIGDGAR